MPGLSQRTKKWFKKVNETSDAMDLENRVFKSKSPKKIARSLKRSAEHSKRPKAKPFQSAMSMLNFFINRAGKNLSKKEKEPLEKSKTNCARFLDGRKNDSHAQRQSFDPAYQLRLFKYQIRCLQQAGQLIAKGKVDHIGSDRSKMTLQAPKAFSEPVEARDIEQASPAIMAYLDKTGVSRGRREPHVCM